VAFKRGAYMRHYVLRLAELLSPRLSKDLITKALAGDAERYEL
jgi:LysR family transcriptional regulator, cys regulon transcriptional activator